MNDLFPVTVTVNGQVYTREVEARQLLSEFLRHDLDLMGTHVGCEHGICGACTIIFDGEAVRSCLMFAVQANGHDIRTVESLGTPDKLHPIQQAFTEKHALQCGYCTPGFLMTLVPFLEKNPDPTEDEVREAIVIFAAAPGMRRSSKPQWTLRKRCLPANRIQEVIQ
jgi:carbon-monoxide dehydrogenase small subunit